MDRPKASDNADVMRRAEELAQFTSGASSADIVDVVRAGRDRGSWDFSGRNQR